MKFKNWDVVLQSISSDFRTFRHKSRHERKTTTKINEPALIAAVSAISEWSSVVEKRPTLEMELEMLAPIISNLLASKMFALDGL